MIEDRTAVATPVTVAPTSTRDDHDRSTTMYHLHEEQVRAQLAVRLGEAQELQRAARYVHLRRSVRRAEKAAARARLALARSL